MRCLIAVIVIVALPTIAISEILNVPGDYSTIQEAIDAASHGDTVLVHPGTYVESIYFKGKAITVVSAKGAGSTVIDGNQWTSVVSCDAKADSALEGFTLTNGAGGGMSNYCSNPMVTNCVFIKNLNVPYGGGMDNWHSNPTVTNCVFIENSADDGGGMNNYYSSPTVTNCSFLGNCGGGMLNVSGDPTVTNCIFYGNKDMYGGGMFNYVSSPTVANCTFFGNSADLEGGGMWNKDSSPTVINTVLWNNDAPEGPEIWIGDSSYQSTLTINYSDVEGGKSSVYVDPGCTLNWGPGMINADPLFVHMANGDFHLTFSSPCRGSGDNTAVTELFDFEGDPRIAYGTVDMGADEFYTHLYWTGDATPGGNVAVKLVGLPGNSPVGLCIGTGVLDPPLPSMWGNWYLQFPIIGPVDMGSITSPEGVLVVPGTIPGMPPAPYSIPMQSLIGAELTNLCVLEVK